MENPINQKPTEQKIHDLSDGWSINLTIMPTNQMGTSLNYKELAILLRKDGRVYLEIAISFWLKIKQVEHSVEQKKSWVRIHGKYDAVKVYDYWMRGITQPDEALPIIPAEWLTKSDIIQWFYNDINLFWWFE
tara:strand:- start:257 stop:655 length:399 start_codon:yes stop_codon:yes gene_type:complete